LENQIEEYSATIDSQRNANLHLKSDVDSLAGKNAKLQSDLQSVQSELVEIRERLDEAREFNKRLQESRDDLERLLQAQTNGEENKPQVLASAKEPQNAIEDGTDKLRSICEKLQRRYSELQERYKAAANDLLELRQRIALSDAKPRLDSDYQAENARLESAVSVLTEMRRNQEQQLQELTSTHRKDTNALTKEIEELRSQNAKYSARNDELQSKQDEISRALADLQGVADSKVHLIQFQCKRAIQQKDLELSRLAEANKDLQNSIVAVERENTMRKAKLAKVRSKHGHLLAQLSTEQKRQTEFAGQYQELVESLKFQKRQNRVLVRELEAL
jgi:chromosome segregation ATPase